MKRIIILLFFIAGIFQLKAQNVKSSESKVTFEISNMGFKTVSGSFTGMDGQVNLSPENLLNSNIDVCIDAKSVNTENKKRDEHLNKDDFFHTDNYPTICFQSTSITKNGDQFIAVGKLTIKGITKTVQIPLSRENNSITGQLTLQRLDYNVGPKGGFMVGKEVELKILCVI